MSMAIAPAVAAARDGAFDRGFGTDGRVSYSVLPGDGGEGPVTVIPLANGDIFSGGSGGGNGWALAMHTRRGVPVGLGGDGLAFHQISPGPGPTSHPLDFVRQSDGRWLGAGFVMESGGQFTAAAARFTPEGDLDSSFGSDPPNPAADGVVRIDFPGTEDLAHGVAVDRAGRILVTGEIRAPSPGGPTELFLARLRRDGSLDSSFGTGGIVIAGPGTDDQGESVAPLPSGRILVAGVSDGDLVLLRFRADGQSDSSYGGGDGIATAPGFGIEAESQAELVVLPSGRVLVGLNDGTSAGMSFDAVFGVARFTAAGLLDRSFSGDGKQRVVAGEDQYFSDIAVADDGRIVLSGRVDSGADADVLVARLMPGGAPDSGFGDRGLVIDHRPGVIQGGGGVAVQRDRRIVVGADTFDGSGGNAALLRLLGDTRRPGTRITSGPSGATAPGRVRFRFRVLRDVHPRFQCKLKFSAGGATPAVLERFRPCRSPFSLRAVEGRAYTFLVRAIDRAGNVDKTPAKRRFRVGG